MGWEGTEAALGAQREGRKELGPEGREGASLTAVHLVRGILAVHKLVAAAGVPNAGAVPAAELAHTTGRLYNSARPVPSAGASPWGPCQPRPDLPAQSACPGPPYRTLNQNPWDLGTKAQRGRGWGGAAGGGEGLRPWPGPHSLLQGISSEPSPQSSAPLHHSMLDTQRPLLHWRKVFLQRRVSAGGSRPQ